VRSLAILVGLAGCLAQALGGEAGPAGGPVDPLAAEVAKAAGRERGLCVMIGGAPELAAALGAGGRSLVIMLSPDEAATAAARGRLQALGAYGAVSAERCPLSALPLAENLANLAVIADPAAAAKAGLSAAEVMRVLTPGGAVVVRSGPGADDLAKALAAAGGDAPAASGGWLRVGKPRPAAHDDWTHPRYDSGGCNVSRDQEVGPPERLRWLAGPAFPGMADYHYGAILSGGGRNYYVLTPGQALQPTFAGAAVADDPASGLPQPKGTGAWLLARDAHNGLPVWRRAYDGNSNTLVADGQRVYAMVGGSAAAIDGETGRVVAGYGKVDYPPGARFLLKDGVLVVSGGKDLKAYDTKAGKPAWTSPVPAKAQLLIEGSQVIVFDAAGKSLSALELATGKEAWKADCSAWLKGKDRLLFGRHGLLVFDAETAGKARHLAGVSAKDGKELWTWTLDGPPQQRWTVLYAGGLVWAQKWMVAGSKEQQWEGLDPATGKSVKTHTVYRTSMYGCHADVATDRHVIFNRPADFMAWADGKVSRFRASRPACSHGATLGNGLFYSAPNICLCVQGVIHGYVGLAAAPSPAPAAAEKPKAESGAAERLETGPAFGKAGDGAAPAAGDWPTFRFDPSRSGAAPGEKFSAKLKVLWTAPVAGARPAGPSLLADEAVANWTGGEPLTAPTVAGGRVFVALPDRHAVAALDAATGKPVWSTTVGGRMDVPPTVHGGLCLTGARDGWVYALAAADGRLAWRCRAAPEERRIVAFGQVESPWPVVGGVLVRDNLAYACFGRSSESDGGAGIACLEPATGKLVWETRPPNDAKGFVGLADLLVADGKAVSCGGSTHFRLDPKTGKLLGREILDAVRSGTTNGQYHGYIGSAATLLDRTWHSSGVTKVEDRFQTQWKDGLTGQIVVFDKTRAVASRLRMADKRVAGTIIAQNRTAKIGEKTEPLWKFELPAGERAVALAIAGEHVLVGAASSDRKQGRLLVLGMKDGQQLAEHALLAAPAAEGIAVAGAAVYVSTWSGEVLCLEGER